MTAATAITATKVIFSDDLSRVLIELSDYRTRAFPAPPSEGSLEERLARFGNLMEAAERGEGEPVCTHCRAPLGPGAEGFPFCPGMPCGAQWKEHYL